VKARRAKPLQPHTSKWFRCQALICAGMACLFTQTPIQAQTGASDQLKDVQGKLRQSITRTQDLTKEVKELAITIAKLRETLVATATRIQTREAQASFIEERVKKLELEEQTLRTKFSARRKVLAELLAGLQRLEQNPPPALAVKPKDAVSALRGAMLLGTIIPEIRSEANGLAQNLARLIAVRRTIVTEQKTLNTHLQELEKERRDVRALLLKKRQASQLTLAEVEAERLHAEKLAKSTKNLKELIAKLGPTTTVNLQKFKANEVKSAALRIALRRQAEKLHPSKKFSNAKGSLNFPAQGIRLAEFGTNDKVGGTTKGMSIATRANAQVTTPVDGRVVYAGAFRSYGRLLIISAGEGYHVLLAGLDKVNVSVGQFILAGEPVGIMSKTAANNSAAVDLESNGRPILYVEFRKDGTSIDPSPWWAGTAKKARG